MALFSFGSMALTARLALGDEAPSAEAAAAAAALPPEELEREAESIARSIMSPFCPGRTVSACPNAGPWREDIRKWVAEGVDAIEIKKRLAERVPEHNLMGVPKNRLGWVLPVGLGIGAIGSLVCLLRYLAGPRAAGGVKDKSTNGKAAGDALGADKLASAKAAPKEAGDAAPANAGAAPAAPGAKAKGDDWDARLEEELETFEQ